MVTDKLKNIILTELNINEFDLKDDTVASQVPGWDSLNHMNIIVAIEDNYNIKFNGIEILKVKNLGDLQDLINHKTETV